MSYSYTEKKRIRKNFGTFAKVMDLPNLIETQTKSYAEFLQADVAPEARKKQGLEDVFQSLFPIKSVSGNAALEYVSYELGKNTYDVQECLVQGFLVDVRSECPGACGAVPVPPFSSNLHRAM